MDAQQERRIRWAHGLEEVLNDFDALQLFQSWMGVDDDSSEHPLRLHFAIVAYREMLAHGDARASQLGREIYNKFLRPKIGICAFIDGGIRERIGQRLKQGGQPPVDLFEDCLSQLEIFLRKQHALFVSSHEFLDYFNSSLCLDPPAIAASSSSGQKASATNRQNKRNNRGGEEQQQMQQMPSSSLTADMLLRSQKEREAMVPTGAASQRLFKPVSKFPYVGQAQPSKNDSAVSSAFSSEANRPVGSGGGNYSLRVMRDEQKRANPPMMATFPRLEPGGTAFNNRGGGMPANDDTSSKQHMGCQFRHDTIEGRQHFADLLQRKLQQRILEQQREELVKKDIEKINAARQKGAKQTARELIGQGANEQSQLLLENSAGMEADEELEKYCRLKMAPTESANSSSNSAQQSPLGPPHSMRTTARRRSRGGHGLGGSSCSPSREGGGGEGSNRMAQHPPPQFHMDWPNRNNPFGGTGQMSQSCCSANPSTSLGFISTHHNHHQQQQQNQNRLPPLPPSSQFGGGHYPLLDSAECSSFFQLAHPPPSSSSMASAHPPPLPPHYSHGFPPMSSQQFSPAAFNFGLLHQQPVPPSSSTSSSAHPPFLHGNIHQQFTPGKFPPFGQSIQMATTVVGSAQLGQTKMPSTPLAVPKMKSNAATATTAVGANVPPGYCDNDGDTSGIGSMTSATHSGTSAPGGTAEQRERQRAAVFRKARELSSGGGPMERQQQQQQQAANGGGATVTAAATTPQQMAGNHPQQLQHYSGIPRQKQQQQQLASIGPPSAAFSPRPRASVNLLPHQSHSQPQQSSSSSTICPQSAGGGPIKMTIGFRNAAGDGVPVVAQIPQRQLTFREFRRILSISSKDRRQFFFKVACEDGSAPYQLLLINDDQAILPIFDGKITAECRSPLSDSD